MSHHPVVMAKSHQMAIGYDDAEAIVRASKDAACVAAVKEIDAARDRERKRASALNTEMAKRLGLPAEQVRALVAALTADPEAETWLLRRVHLTRAHDRPPDDDEHHENE